MGQKLSTYPKIGWSTLKTATKIVGLSLVGLVGRCISRFKGWTLGIPSQRNRNRWAGAGIISLWDPAAPGRRRCGRAGLAWRVEQLRSAGDGDVRLSSLSSPVQESENGKPVLQLLERIRCHDVDPQWKSCPIFYRSFHCHGVTWKRS